MTNFILHGPNTAEQITQEAQEHMAEALAVLPELFDEFLEKIDEEPDEEH